MVEYTGKQTVVSLFIVEFHVFEEHLARFEPQCVTLDQECGVYDILYEVAVLEYGFTLHVHVGQFSEQT